MKKIALTGGIASGKSTVIWYFRDMGSTIINADDIAHELMEPKTHVWKMLFERYGSRIMQNGGQIDRRSLGKIVFDDDDERKNLESIMHPRIHEIIQKRMADFERQNIPYVIAEIPLLFETGWEKDFDAVIVVRCDYEQQVERCMQKFGIDRSDAEKRINLQKPMKTKADKADAILPSAI